jgi:uncharacterized Fe-S cluster-containing MiaB family protein
MSAFGKDKDYLAWPRLHGETYQVKEQLKAIGCRWNAVEQCWMCPPDQYKEARNIVLNCEGQMSFEDVEE